MENCRIQKTIEGRKEGENQQVISSTPGSFLYNQEWTQIWIDTKSSCSIKSFTTPTKKPLIKIQEVTTYSNEVKIIQAKPEQKDNDSDDMSTISYSSNKGYFGSSNNSSKEDVRKVLRPAFKIKRKQDELKKKKRQDIELDKIIKRFEGEHITMEETSQRDKEILTKGAEIKKKQEEDDNLIEVVYSTKSIQDMGSANGILRQSNYNNEH